MTTDLSCRCGAVRLRVKKLPEFASGCNCETCHELNVSWGTTSRSQVKIEGVTMAWQDHDDNAPMLDIRQCAKCGDATHQVPTEHGLTMFPADHVGINMRLKEVEKAGH